MNRKALILGIIFLIAGVAIGYLISPSQVRTVTETVTQTATATVPLTTTTPVKEVEIKVGILLPLSGGSAFDGQEDLRGIQLAALHINQSKYPNVKFKMKLVIADTQTRQDVGVTELRRLDQEGVVAVIGAYNSAVTYPTAGEAEKIGLPYVVPEAVADRITAQGWKYVFRTCANASKYAYDAFWALADMAKAKGVEIRTVAYIYENSDFGVFTVEGLKKSLNKFFPNAKAVYEESYPAELVTSMDDMVAKLKAANPDVVFHVAYLKDAVLFVQTMKKLDWYPKAYLGAGAGGQTRVEFIDQLGKDSNFVFTQTEWQPDFLTSKALAKWAWIDEDFKKLYGRSMVGSSGLNYVGAYVLAVAIQNALDSGANPSDLASFRKAVRNALEGIKIPAGELPLMPWGVDFISAPNHQNPEASVAMAQILEGKFRVVWPIEFAPVKPVLPTPGWGGRS
ncbi:MAG: ABC transporter substrate-binding protein [Candidatus Korarchaeum sp.]|nr:ABC transporter substrate-binding protein [Candidatus Korarchaeum sp.]MDW8036001.1 ABC transporter substrate-binding protein [Candidatus Korarchaeum sp.]